MEPSLAPDPLPIAAWLRERLPEDLAGYEPSPEIRRALQAANPIDLAHAFRDLEPAQRLWVFDHLAPESRAAVLAETDPESQAELLLHIGEQGAAELLARLNPDDAADILNVLDPPAAESILRSLEAEEAAEIRELRRYPADSAGSLMTPDVIAVPPEAKESEVLRKIRQNPDVETINIIYVVKAGRLAGVLSIRDLLLAHPDQAVSQIMTSEVIKVRDEAPREEVIRAIEIYHLGAVPIVDAEDRLLGIVTADDAFTALEEEASEDVLALAGAAGPLPTRSGVLRRVRTRLPWLLVTLAGGLLGSFLIQGLSRWFGRADAVGPLGRFLPLVAGMAGNVAMQSAAVMVRGFATGEIPRFRRGRVIADEILVAGTVGCLCGAVAGLIAVSTGAGTGLATAVSLSIATASTLGGVSGTVIPTACVLLRIDPAVASGPFITTLNDLVGFAVYMTVAIALLGVVAN